MSYAIYTLFYKDTGLYNHNVFVCPNEETAKKAMKLNLADSKNERFRNECATGDVELRKLCGFDECAGCGEQSTYNKTICNLKDLMENKNE